MGDKFKFIFEQILNRKISDREQYGVFEEVRTELEVILGREIPGHETPEQTIDEYNNYINNILSVHSKKQNK